MIAIYRVTVVTPEVDEARYNFPMEMRASQSYFVGADQAEAIMNGLTGIEGIEVEVAPIALVNTAKVVADVKAKVAKHAAFKDEQRRQHLAVQRQRAAAWANETPAETKALKGPRGEDLTMSVFKRKDQPGFLRNMFDCTRVEGMGRIYCHEGRLTSEEAVRFFLRNSAPAESAEAA